MKKENILIVIAGLLLLSYALEAITNPLQLSLPTPYHFLTSQYLNAYPFTAALIIIRSLGIFLIPLLLMSFMEGNYFTKGGILLVLIALMQLYSLQNVVTKTSATVPLEWALAISIGGILLIPPMIWYLLLGGLSLLHKSLGGGGTTSQVDKDEDKED